MNDEKLAAISKKTEDETLRKREEAKKRYWRDRIEVIRQRAERDINKYKRWIRDPMIRLKEIKVIDILKEKKW